MTSTTQQDQQNRYMARMRAITERLTVDQISDALTQLDAQGRAAVAAGEHVSEIVIVELALINELDRRGLVDTDDYGRVTWRHNGAPIPGEE